MIPYWGLICIVSSPVCLLISAWNFYAQVALGSSSLFLRRIHWDLSIVCDNNYDVLGQVLSTFTVHENVIDVLFLNSDLEAKVLFLEPLTKIDHKTTDLLFFGLRYLIWGACWSHIWVDSLLKFENWYRLWNFFLSVVQARAHPCKLLSSNYSVLC